MKAKYLLHTHPSVKRVPGLVLGSKVHWLCLTLQGAHTCLQWEAQSVLLRAPCLGSRRLHRTDTMCLLSAQVSQITRCA